MKRKNVPESQLRELYINQQKSMRECARILSIDPSTVMNRLRKYGIQARTVSQANKGRTVWNKGKTGMQTSWLKGTKGLVTAWNKGKKCPNQSGENHHNWKGGISPLRKWIPGTLEYKQWRRAVFQKDDFTCRQCRSRGGYLHVHHIKPMREILEEYQIKSIEEAIGCAELWNVNNGVTLCRDCHAKTDSMRARFFGPELSQLELAMYARGSD